MSESIMLWKENRIDHPWTITFKDLREQFYKSQMYREFQGSWPIDRMLRNFISDKDGLNSIFEDDDYQELLGFVADGEGEESQKLQEGEQ